MIHVTCSHEKMSLMFNGWHRFLWGIESEQSKIQKRIMLQVCVYYMSLEKVLKGTHQFANMVIEEGRDKEVRETSVGRRRKAKVQ